jgi:glycosyltransferase involved in cell wall biosynthesis
MSSTYCLVIPAYEPDDHLINLVDTLLGGLAHNIDRIIVVNDGSKATASLQIFDQLRTTRPRVEVLSHACNRGKGAALKTGFARAAQYHGTSKIVVTADADGQHAAEDVLRVAKGSLASGSPCIGVRKFNGTIPFRSRFGNLFTRALFRFVSGHKVQDTQTGLRAYLMKDIPSLCAISADRYDFEFHALFQMCRQGKLLQIPVATLYAPRNPTSHFRTILDSMKIYAVFARYTTVSMISSVSDWLIFSILTLTSLSTFSALLTSRLIVLPLYFVGMRKFAFRARSGNAVLQGVLIAALALVHFLSLWQLTNLINGSLALSRPSSMLISLSLLYVVGFIVQRAIFTFHPVRSFRWQAPSGLSLLGQSSPSSTLQERAASAGTKR